MRQNITMSLGDKGLFLVYWQMSKMITAKTRRNRKAVRDFDANIRHQVAYAHLLQQTAEELLDTIESNRLTEDQYLNLKKWFQILQSTSQQMIVLLKMLVTLNKEVVATQFELERPMASTASVATAKRKLPLLKKRLKIFLHISKEICNMKFQGKMDGNSAKICPQGISRTFVRSPVDNKLKDTLQWDSSGSCVTDAINVTDSAKFDVEKAFFLTSHQNGSSSSEVEGCVEEEASALAKNKDGSKSGVKKSDLLVADAVEIKPDLVDKYWNSDHHRFEWTNFMQKLDPLSWHALAISYPDSFLKGDEKFPSDEIPWRFNRNMREGSTFGQNSIENLHENVQALFRAVIDASVSSVKVNEQAESTPSSGLARGRRNARNKHKTTKNTDVKRDDILPYIDNIGLNYYRGDTKEFLNKPVSLFLPVITQDAVRQFPRQPTIWCDLSKVDIPKHSSYLRGTKKGLKEVPTISTKRQNLNRATKNRGHLSLKQAVGRVAAFAKLKPEKDQLVDPSGLKWKRITELLGDSGINSENKEVAIDAFKSLSQLGIFQKEIIQAIRSRVAKESDQHVLYEAGKCVLSLGWWDTFAVTILEQALKNGERNLKLDVFDAIINSKNARFIRKSRDDIARLIQCIVHFVHSKDQDLAFKASLSLGHLCVVNSDACDHLFTRLHDSSFSVRMKAMESLVVQMNSRDSELIDAILFQLGNARNWKQRIAAATLLQKIGVVDVTKGNPDRIFDILEKLLWNHPSEDVRTKVAEVITEFGMRPKSVFLVHKRLENLEEDVRSNAIQMLSSLRMKGEKEIRILLDIVELDSSINVRIQALKAFDALKLNDPRVIRCLQEREKGDGVLARVAAAVLKSLMRIDGTSQATQ